MKTSNEIKTLLTKLFAVKQKMGKLKKDSDNPFFKSSYADLNQHIDEVEPLLTEQKLLLLQPVNRDEVTTTIFDTESGQWISSTIQINGKDMQQLGAAVTYGRRFTLGSLLAMQAVDDDGNFASGKTEKLVSSNKTPVATATSKPIPSFKNPVKTQQPASTGDDL